MKPEINQQQLENDLLEILDKDIEYIPESMDISYNPHYGTTFVWLEFDSRESALSLSDIERLKRRYKKAGYKVSNFVVYPLASCQFAFRIVIEL